MQFIRNHAYRMVLDNDRDKDEHYISNGFRRSCIFIAASLFIVLVHNDNFIYMFMLDVIIAHILITIAYIEADITVHYKDISTKVTRDLADMYICISWLSVFAIIMNIIYGIRMLL